MFGILSFCGILEGNYFFCLFCSFFLSSLFHIRISDNVEQNFFYVSTLSHIIMIKLYCRFLVDHCYVLVKLIERLYFSFSFEFVFSFIILFGNATISLATPSPMKIISFSRTSVNSNDFRERKLRATSKTRNYTPQINCHSTIKSVRTTEKFCHSLNPRSIGDFSP